MNYKIFLVAFTTLFASSSVHATASVFIRLPSEPVCDPDGYRGCDDGSPGSLVETYTSAELDAIHAALNQQITILQNENKLLKSMIDQREADIKLLAKKVDFADERIAQLEKALKDLAAKSAIAPNVRRALKPQVK
ncbi:hypothetical protein [Methylomonas sp. TEB]|uniref:hypothetical protein n=1 Tax=Methylomonas sp. TEB TaxID=3398229 RepID=UPI0039F5D1BB